MISLCEAGFWFVFKARRRAQSWDSVTEAATLKTGKKTHKMGILFASKSLLTMDRERLRKLVKNHSVLLSFPGSVV